jgi:hypothetical protein
VDDAVPMAEFQGIGNVCQHEKPVDQIDFVVIQDALQARPVEEFHDDRAVGLAVDDLDEANDVFMIQVKDVGFVVKRLVFDEVGFLDDLHGDRFVFV